ncbi:dihydrodipicolinate synthase family protein [Nitratireductor luteus]|uniref:dihydrodipicolinate synthase family protein n=1 Tax=Nitratireductor luteus TaxID=2976980 RepID=UPI00224058D1|nr:dihydrodipicolinate synthase family protein [Nitratireductor luteus]
MTASSRQNGGTFGISAALVTPFRDDFSIDLERMAAHATGLLADGCARVTLFGTTGEGASLSMTERLKAQYALTSAGVAPDRIVACVGGAAVGSVAEQALASLDTGIRTLLVPPPYYFKGVSQEGLFRWYSALIGQIAGQSPRIILYHIPQVTAAALSLELVRRLKDRFGEFIVGIKDSAGDWATTEAFLGERDLQVLVGDERHLAHAVRLGGAGAISGMANLFPSRLAELVATGKNDPELSALVDAVVKLPVTPAVKALVGVMRGEKGWDRVRAPLDSTPASDVEMLREIWQAMGRDKAA